MGQRSSSQWAARALRVAQHRAASKTDPAQQAATLQRGIRTALAWLSGTHPKIREHHAMNSPAPTPETAAAVPALQDDDDLIEAVGIALADDTFELERALHLAGHAVTGRRHAAGEDDHVTLLARLASGEEREVTIRRV